MLNKLDRCLCCCPPNLQNVTLCKCTIHSADRMILFCHVTSQN